jgi:hypothetical protein
MKRLLSFIIVIIECATCIGASPSRDLGLSIHMFPDQVAKISGGHGGFSISSVGGVKLPRNQKILVTATDVLSFFNEQKKSVQEGGIWIVFTDPDSYSKEELDQLSTLKKESKAKGIALFTCRASELPGGWKQE